MPPKRKAAEVSKSQPASKKSKVTTKKKQVKVSKAKTKDTKKVKQVKAEPQKLSQAKHVKTSTLCLKDLLKNDEWKAALFEEFSKDYFKEIEKKLAAEYADKKQVFPPQDLIFNAFHLTPLDKVKVVILDHVIKTVSEKCPHVVFIFWGNFAHKKASLVDSKKHEVIKTAHPSPLSIKYFKECNCFSDCDKALKKF
ncbi:UNG-like protein, partial [Mya arenaria]